MNRPTPLLLISFGLVSLTLSILLMGDLAVDLIPDSATQVFDYRKRLSEALAVQYSLFGEAGNERAIEEGLFLVVQRNADILSAALTLRNGDILVKAGPHERLWEQRPDLSSTIDHIQVPIFYDEGRWGTLQLRFRSLPIPGWMDWLNHPWVQFLLLVMASGFLGYYFYMKRTLRQLDPSSVVPLRVKTAFDVLTEGVVLLDGSDQIVLANRSFSQIVGVESDVLIGKPLGEFRWRSPGSPTSPSHYPWEMARSEKCLELDFPLMLRIQDGQIKKFQVNCSPILDELKLVRGSLVSFNDVTQLQEIIHELEVSKGELEKLAMRDPLTGCFNRRALFDAFEDQWVIGQTQGQDLGCIMTDIDHFKSFNDRFGHAVGDQVIQVVAKILGEAIRPVDILGRYGGEEFCILLPGSSPEQTALAAERLRREIEEQAKQIVRTTSGTCITMSFGVSAFSLGASDPLDLVDQADKALYAAKQGGRNQVGEWTPHGPETGNLQTLELAALSYS